MKKKNIINAFFLTLAVALILVGYYLNNPDYSQIAYIAAVVIGLLAIMRLFKIKRFATED